MTYKIWRHQHFYMQSRSASGVAVIE